MIDNDLKGFKSVTQSMKKDVIYSPKLNEDVDLKELIPQFPVNKKMNYNQGLMVKAIEYGMIIQIFYKGDKDDGVGGERIIYPMVIGINRNTKNELLRAWHLEGYSYSGKGKAEKVWRLFKTKNIKSMIFTGNFYRMPPIGYKSNDRILTERIIKSADFNVIRRNQDKLVKSGAIQKEEEAQFSKTPTEVSKIEIKNTGTVLSLRNPWDNEILEKLKNQKNLVKISILKSVLGNEWIAIIGALGTKDRSVRVSVDKKLLGTYKTMEAFTGDQINKFRVVRAMSEFDLYQFIKKG